MFVINSGSGRVTRANHAGRGAAAHMKAGVHGSWAILRHCRSRRHITGIHVKPWQQRTLLTCCGTSETKLRMQRLESSGGSAAFTTTRPDGACRRRLRSWLRKCSGAATVTLLLSRSQAISRLVSPASGASQLPSGGSGRLWVLSDSSRRLPASQTAAAAMLAVSSCHSSSRASSSRPSAVATSSRSWRTWQTARRASHSSKDRRRGSGRGGPTLISRLASSTGLCTS